MKHSVTTLNTKRLIASSLKKIMSKKPFSKIIVTEIIKDCGVNRKTFYYHFADIYALLKWMFEEEAVEVVKNFDIYTNPEEAIEFVIEYVEKNEHIISCAYDLIGRVEMKNFFSSDFRGIINGVITKAEKSFAVELDADYKKIPHKLLHRSIFGNANRLGKGQGIYRRKIDGGICNQNGKKYNRGCYAKGKG